MKETKTMLMSFILGVALVLVGIGNIWIGFKLFEADALTKEICKGYEQSNFDEGKATCYSVDSNGKLKIEKVVDVWKYQKEQIMVE